MEFPITTFFNPRQNEHHLCLETPEPCQPYSPALAKTCLRPSPAQQVSLSFSRLETAQEGVKCIAVTAAGICMSCILLELHPPQASGHWQQ